MTLALIAVIVFLIIWGNQVGNMKAAQAEEKRLTRTNVALEREVAKKEIDRLIAKMDFVDPLYNPVYYLGNLYTNEDIPLDYRWLHYTDGDTIVDKLQYKAGRLWDNNELLLGSDAIFNPRRIYNCIFCRYWILKKRNEISDELFQAYTRDKFPAYMEHRCRIRTREYAKEEEKQFFNEIKQMDFDDDELVNAARLYVKMITDYIRKMYSDNNVSLIYRGPLYFSKSCLAEDTIINSIPEELILSLPPLPYYDPPDALFSDIYKKFINLISIQQFPMDIRILSSEITLNGFNQLIHYGTLQREMHNLGYAVSEDGIHESDIQEREKADKAHEEEKKKYPWMYHDNKYVNSDKSFWDRMK